MLSLCGRFAVAACQIEEDPGAGSHANLSNSGMAMFLLHDPRRSKLVKAERTSLRGVKIERGRARGLPPRRTTPPERF